MIKYDKIRSIADRTIRNVKTGAVGVDGKTPITLASLKAFDHEAWLGDIERHTGRSRDTWTPAEWEHTRDCCTARLTAIRELEEELCS